MLIVLKSQRVSFDLKQLRIQIAQAFFSFFFFLKLLRSQGCDWALMELRTKRLTYFGLVFNRRPLRSHQDIGKEVLLREDGVGLHGRLMCTPHVAQVRRVYLFYCVSAPIDKFRAYIAISIGWSSVKLKLPSGLSTYSDWNWEELERTLEKVFFSHRHPSGMYLSADIWCLRW